MSFPVHADASNFADGVTKGDAYEQVLMQAEGLCTDQRNWQRGQLCIFALARLQIVALSKQARQLGR
ncbi:hypothetical protein E4U54_000330 [Claviceps lovelessii]|nr:hypothetical protein E4U54_000330 [Claviceps lovelessii]